MKWVTWQMCIMNCFSCCQWEAQPIKCEISWTHWGQSKLITEERTLPDSELSFLTAAYSAPVFLGFAFPFFQRNCLSSLFLIQTGKAVVSAYNFPKEETWLRCSSNHPWNALARSLYVLSLKEEMYLHHPVRLWVVFFSFFPLFLISFPLTLSYIFFLCSIILFSSLFSLTAVIRDVTCLPFPCIVWNSDIQAKKTQVTNLF